MKTIRPALIPALIAILKSEGSALYSGRSKQEFEEMVAYCQSFHGDYPFELKIEPTGATISGTEEKSYLLRLIVPSTMSDADVQNEYENFQERVQFLQSFVSGWFARAYFFKNPDATGLKALNDLLHDEPEAELGKPVAQIAAEVIVRLRSAS